MTLDGLSISPSPTHPSLAYLALTLPLLSSRLKERRQKEERRKNDNNELRLASCIELRNLLEMNYHWLSKSIIHSRCSLSPGDFYMIFWLHLKEKRHNQYLALVCTLDWFGIPCCDFNSREKKSLVRCHSKTIVILLFSNWFLSSNVSAKLSILPEPLGLLLPQ